MRHVIFSSTLALPTDAAVEVARGEVEPTVRALKQEAGGDIYLCGGGILAGQCLRAGLIDRLILKINPTLIGRGTPLFVGAEPRRLQLIESKRYASGVVLAVYDL
jgi:dihydrofolate reductase